MTNEEVIKFRGNNLMEEVNKTTTTTSTNLEARFLIKDFSVDMVVPLLLRTFSPTGLNVKCVLSLATWFSDASTGSRSLSKDHLNSTIKALTHSQLPQFKVMLLKLV